MELLDFSLKEDNRTSTNTLCDLHELHSFFLFVWLFFLQLYNCYETGTDRQRCVHLQLSRVCFVLDIQCVSTPLWLSCTC